MLFLLAALADAPFTPPQPWALNLAPTPVIPLVGDVDGDRLADIVNVNPKAVCEIGVTRKVEGIKPAPPATTLRNWGKEAQAVVLANADATPGMDVVGMFGGTELRLAKAYKDGVFTDWLNDLACFRTFGLRHSILCLGCG
jgi:hypothetical protein